LRSWAIWKSTEVEVWREAEEGTVKVEVVATPSTVTTMLTDEPAA
jgi:hypothetical protein